MKRGKPQTNLEVHGVRLSDVSRHKRGKMEMKFGDYGDCQFFHIRDNKY